MIEENNGRAVMRFSAPVTRVQSLADGGWQLTIRPGQDSAAAAAMLLVIAMDTENMIDWVATERVRKYQPVEAQRVTPPLSMPDGDLPTLDDALGEPDDVPEGVPDDGSEMAYGIDHARRTRFGLDFSGGIRPD